MSCVSQLHLQLLTEFFLLSQISGTNFNNQLPVVFWTMACTCPFLLMWYFLRWSQVLSMLNLQNTQNLQHTHTKHTETHTHTVRTQTHSQLNFYWTRIQLLNPDSGSVPSLLLHLDKSALISADSSCPPCTLTRSHTGMQLIPIRVWLNENCDAHFSIPGVNEYQWELSQSLLCVCVYICEWQRGRSGTGLAIPCIPTVQMCRFFS